VEVFNVLAQMVGASERAVCFAFLGAFDDAVRVEEVVFAGVFELAERAHGGCAGARGEGEAGAGGEAGPLVFGAVLGFFVAAPGFGD
jgi:hypothetical protein